MVLTTGAYSVSGLQAPRWRPTVAWLVAAAMLAGGCTTVKTKQLPPEALQAQIRSGAIVEAGDKVAVVTRDGEEHTFKVSAVGTDAIAGALEGGGNVTVPIDDVLSLRVEEVSVGRTALAGVGVYMLVVGIAFALAITDIMEEFTDAIFGGASD